MAKPNAAQPFRSIVSDPHLRALSGSIDGAGRNRVWKNTLSAREDWKGESAWPSSTRHSQK
jgi:hypothetical protein